MATKPKTNPRQKRRSGKRTTDGSRDRRTITFIGAGKYSDVFKVRDGGRTVIMKLSYYRDDTLCRFVEAAKRGDLRTATRAKNTDSIAVSSNFARVTNDFVTRGISPHFVVVYCDMDCKNFASRLKALLPERFHTMTAVQMKYNNMCFMEVFHSNLTKWLTAGRYDDATLRGVLFQVLYTLAALQKLLPGFRHNDLSANNVLVKKLSKPVTYVYAWDGGSTTGGSTTGGSTTGGSTTGGSGGSGGSFAEVRSKLLVALSDYDFTHVPNNAALTNERIVNGRYKVDASPNPSYDPHFFLRSVQKATMLHQGKIPLTTKFLGSIGMRPDIDRLEAPIPGFTPAKLLRHPYFDALRRQFQPASDVFSHF